MKKVNYSYLKWILLALLLLPTLSGIDSLGLSDGYSISFTFILFYLGVIEASEEKTFFNHFFNSPLFNKCAMCHYDAIMF
ncbi:hypothetical protein [Catenibacterium sp.]|uniref:hypothetical protein n=1 Tax=Catenibacterium sp. TaxID=2049022 RepID=UPI003990EE21